MIVLINLGSPQKLTRFAVAKYLFEFLMDKNVVTAPFLVRLFIVGGLIAPFRSKNTLKIYSEIWFKDKKYGSPLLHYTNALAEKLQKKTSQKVVWAMRYQNPSLKKIIKTIAKKKDEKIIFVPLYPHYTLSTFVTVEDQINHLMKKKSPEQKYKITKPFWDREDYLDLLAEKIKNSGFTKTKYPYLLFSYHGIPEVHLKMVEKTTGQESHCLTKGCCDSSKNKNICYRYQTVEMSNRVAKKLGLRQDQYGFSYQSRLGPQKWLMPNTEETIKKIVTEKKIKQLAIVSPAFVSDNLETLYEINIELREIFEEVGGEKLLYVSCVNDDDKWVNILDKIIKD